MKEVAQSPTVGDSDASAVIDEASPEVNSPNETVAAEEVSAESTPSSSVTSSKESQDSKESTVESSADENSANGEADADVEAQEEASAASEQDAMDWYILKVQSNREDSIRDGLLRRIKVAGLEELFEEIVVPTEMVSEYKDGKRRTRKKKLWPGYIIVHMEITEDTWFLVRETPGIGDFTGAGGKPTPMLKDEVEKILKLIHPEEHAPKEKTPVKIAFDIGDQVKIKEGTFQNFDGEVNAVDHANGRVTVITEIFNRKTPVEVDYWQIERV